MVKLVLARGNMRYFILDDVFQALMCFDYCISICFRNEV
jgi:hypothetical protein